MTLMLRSNVVDSVKHVNALGFWEFGMGKP